MGFAEKAVLAGIISELRDRGMTYLQISEEVGHSHSHIKKVAKLFGIQEVPYGRAAKDDPASLCPPCFNGAVEFALWRQAAQAENPGRSSYCTDCTPEYQAKMIRCGRCIFPGTTFSEDDDGLVAGKRP